MSALQAVAKKWLSDVYWFSRLVIRRPLYRYQQAPARAIVNSVIRNHGLEFAVMFPRQSGKNETQAQVEAYLLNLFQRRAGAALVKAQPTYKPQAVNAMLRLERALTNDWNKGTGGRPPAWRKREGYIYQLGQAMLFFFSAEPSANAVGATASILLECDEAQDVLEAEWQKKFVPMAASTNATVVYWGTAWTSRTLLAKTIRQLRELEQVDGRQRVFIVTPEQVALDNPAYAAFVQRQVDKLGRNHPLVKTQFFNEEIDAEGGMFPPWRLALMRGSHPPQVQPTAGTPSAVYAMLLDVAGEDEGALSEAAIDAAPAAALDNPSRDATALTIVEVDLSTISDFGSGISDLNPQSTIQNPQFLGAPTYHAVARRLWVGVKHASLYAQLRALADLWRPRYFVVDATGVGAGLASFLAAALPPGVVIPFTFTPASKSKLGWDFLAICDTGRWKEWKSEVGDQRSEVGSQRTDKPAPGFIRHPTSDFRLPISDFHTTQAVFWREAEFCQYEVLPGPSRLLRWSVPNGTRHPATRELVHDDTLTSAALAAVLDVQPWSADTGPTHIIRAPDPLKDMDKGF